MAALLLFGFLPMHATGRTAHPVVRPRPESAAHSHLAAAHSHAPARAHAHKTTGTESKPDSRKAAKPHGKHVAPAARPAHKSRRHRSRPQEVDDPADPIVMHRVKSRRTHVNKPASQAVARAAAKTPAPGTSSSPVQEIAETGTAHPDDEETTTLNRAAAAASASPALPAASAVMATPGVRPTLPADHEERVAAIEQAIQPVVLRTRNGRVIMPPPLKGSRDVLVHQNTMANSEGLMRVQDDDDLNRLRASHQLVLLPESGALIVNPELPYSRRYARPWASRFAADMARSYYAQFHQPLRLSSAVRTVAYQIRLQRVNGNAAAVEGETASPHLTGQALDFGKRGMSMSQIAWMRAYLLPLMQAGKIDVEEEFHQACFHISVYRSYTGATRSRVPTRDLAQAGAAKPSSSTLPAALATSQTPPLE